MVIQRSHHGLDVPEYLLQHRDELIRRALDILLEVLGRGNVAELRHSIGGFVDIACSRIEDVMQGTDDTKMVLYASHDTAVMCVLLVLGVFDEKWAPLREVFL